MLHAHTTGVSVETTVIRNGVEIELNVNRRYDFNYQNADFMDPEFDLRPGDFLKTVCKYTSTSRTSTVVGGIGTTDEMCMNYLTYYPKNPNIPMTNCMSYLPLDARPAQQAGVIFEFRTLAIAGGISATTFDAAFAYPVSNWPAAFTNAGITWTATQVNWWKQAWAIWNTKQIPICHTFSGGQQVTVPAISTPLAPTPRCLPSSSSSSGGSGQGSSSGQTASATQAATTAATTAGLLFAVVAVLAHLF
jgi:hypothetical protein